MKFISLGIVMVLVGFFITNYITAANFGNKQEQLIKAQHTDLKNVLGQYSLKVAEAAQVPDMYRDDMSKLVSEAMAGRYGQNGSKAIFQWLKEDNSMAKLDSTLYIKIQNIIDGGRDRFTNEQTRFLDTKRLYETELGSVWMGLWLKLAGYPKIDLNEYDVVLASDTQEIFKNKKQEPIKLRD